MRRLFKTSICNQNVTEEVVVLGINLFYILVIVIKRVVIVWFSYYAVVLKIVLVCACM